MAKHNTTSRRLDIDTSTPIESRRDERGGIIIDVVVPLLQSFLVGILAACVVVALINLVYDSGELPFWIGSGSIAFLTFFWIVIVQWDQGVTPLDVVSAFLMALLAGFFCFAFARVATWARDGWLPMWTLWSFVFIVVFYLHVQMTLLQRLAQPWQFQRQAIWGTFKTLAEFWGKRERPPEPPEPVEPPMQFEFSEAGKNGWRREDAPYPRGTMVWIARVLSEVTFSEASLCGPDNPLPGGAGGRAELETLREWMIDNGLLRWNRTNGDGEPVRTQGVSLTADGLRWVEEVGK